MKTKKILIVDDAENVLIMLSNALKAEGIEVITAKMEEAGYAIKNTLMNVVLADIHLTGVQGQIGLKFLHHVHEKSPLI
jgi:DNA-binding NtrC family response regulator